MPGGGAATDRAKEDVSFLTNSHFIVIVLLVNRVRKKNSDIYSSSKKTGNSE